jgi:predicted site-specific integrase-resolvase
VSVKTPQRCDREGRVVAERTKSGRRVYSTMSLDAFMRRMSPNIARVAVAYCGVSSTAQKRDLKNQRRVLEDFYAVRGVANVEEVGGGLNLKRPKFAALMDRIEARQISPLVIAHKDRLVRFGLVRAFLRRARDRVSCPQRRTTLATTGNGARLAGALLFRSASMACAITAGNSTRR